METIYASIITIGDELLIGQTIDTNSAWIAQELNKLGIWVRYRIAVGDVKKDIVDALVTCHAMSQLVIITGGLGPTADDITKPLLCEYFDGELIENTVVKEHVTQLFTKRKRPILDVNIAQAMVPSTCEVLWNGMGTAPGMWFEKEKRITISLPGVPFEMKNIMEEVALQKIQQYFTTPSVIHKTIATAGKGESFIAVTLKEFEANLPATVKLAYLPQLGGVKLRLTGIDSTDEAMTNLQNELYQLVQPIAFALQDIPLEKHIGEQLLAKQKTVAFAESCTGGSVCRLITSISGSSVYCKGSAVVYTNEVKHRVLQVPNELIEQHGAVSQEVAEAMAMQARTHFGSDIAVSTTGYMEKSKTVTDALVWVSVTDGTNTKTQSSILPYNREKNTELAVQFALNLLRVFLSNG
jgi:nicotinamide-nucleotide amidase